MKTTVEMFAGIYIYIYIYIYILNKHIYFNVRSTLFQQCSDVENETKSDVGFSILYNVDATSVPDVETMLKRYTRSKQRCTPLVQG